MWKRLSIDKAEVSEEKKIKIIQMNPSVLVGIPQTIKKTEALKGH